MEIDTVFAMLKDELTTEFKIKPDSISNEKRLVEDLELDSLDMVDLIISLQEHTGIDIDPALFRNALTIQDLVDLLLPLYKSV